MGLELKWRPLAVNSEHLSRSSVFPILPQLRNLTSIPPPAIAFITNDGFGGLGIGPFS